MVYISLYYLRFFTVHLSYYYDKTMYYVFATEAILWELKKRDFEIYVLNVKKKKVRIFYYKFIISVFLKSF